MKIIELTVEDVKTKSIEEFRLLFNEEYPSLEESKNPFADQEIKEFLKKIGKPIAAGNHCFLFTCIWARDFNLIKITNFNERFEILKVLPNQLVVKNDKGDIKYFPEQIGSVVDSTNATVCFNSNQQKEHALTLLKVKFSNWDIKE